MSGFEFTENGRKHLESLSSLVDARLAELKKNAVSETDKQKKIADAMWYSLMAGGKRIRPVLTMEFCRMCRGNASDALSPACALEMIHTFSLVHDDLPCMDNDDMRRGKPSCHKAYGEAMALLAGDALLNYAYEVIGTDEKLTAETRIKLVTELSHETGIKGMIGGQVIDTAFEETLDEQLLLEMYSMKTGALLSTACKMGCITANADGKKLEYADIFARKLGLAFQIIDDILDITGDEKLVGKPIGSDEECGKITYASLKGIEKSRAYAKQLTDEALDILDNFDNNGFMKELTSYLLNRKY